MHETREAFRFRDFELDVAAYELRRNGRRVRLERHPMDLLILLVGRRNELVARADIVQRLWGNDVFVDVETGVHTAMRKLRQALRDSPDAPVFVETVPGRGYRFIAPVEVVPNRLGVTQGQPPPATEREAAAPSNAGAGFRMTGRTSLFIGALAVVLLGGWVTWTRLDWRSPEKRTTLAVLPFENIGRDPDRQYLAAGLTEETSASLAQVDPEHLIVKGRTMRYKGTTKTAAEIGRELSVDYLLESSIQAEGDRLRVTAKLIRVRDQEHVWSQSYDHESASLLGLQRELSTAIAEQIRLRFSPERLDAVMRRQTRNADAYDLYLRGLNFANQRTPATTRRAIEYFERATAMDPNYALAWSGLADAYAASPLNGDAPPRAVGARAREALVQAIRADPKLASSQYSLGYVRWIFDWDWPAAEVAFRSATAVDPGHAWSHISLGHLLSQSGRHNEARWAMLRGRELDPLEAMTHALSSQVAFQARDYPAAVEHAQNAIALDSQFWVGHVMRGQAYVELGKTDLALEALTTAARFSEHNSKTVSVRGYLLARIGRASEARDVLQTLEAVSRTKYVPPYAMALVNAGLGNRDVTFDWLDRAYEARDPHLMYLTVDPKWDALRADPRFEGLLVRCGFTRKAVTASSAH